MTLDRTQGRNPNLGFGMVPPSASRMDRYQEAAQVVLRSLSGDADEAAILDAISEVKGLCNRIIREDQPDWMLVWLWMGLPERRRLKWMAYDLVAYRAAHKERDAAQASYVAERLQRAGLMTALNYFLKQDEPPVEEGMGFLYLLSSRQNKQLLKIGQTRREIIKRVDEINRATGLVEPLSVRHLWRVRDPVSVEREVHQLLAQHRVRVDREFFLMEFRDAVRTIDEYLAAADATVRRRGVVKRVFPERGFGFLTSEDIDFFIHASEVADDQFQHLAVGDPVTFDRLDTSFGLAAAKVVRLATG
jgi:cold shock CspA family protein